MIQFSLYSMSQNSETLDVTQFSVTEILVAMSFFGMVALNRNSPWCKAYENIEIPPKLTALSQSEITMAPIFSAF